MKRTIVCDSAWGDSLKERYEAESKKMIQLQMQMKKVLEQAKIEKEKEKQFILERTKLMNQRDALESDFITNNHSGI